MAPVGPGPAQSGAGQYSFVLGGGMPQDREPFRFAAQCLYLQVTMGDLRRGQGLVNICRHMIRDGRECVGPFLEDTETTCGLWEARPRSGLRELRG